MTLGPGKYDDICTLVRRAVGLTDQSEGGAIVIVFGGARGAGFSCQADYATTLVLPDILENIARQIRSGGMAGP